MAGFFLSAVIGLLLNIIIIEKYNSATLGYFNQVYALYIFLSQVATWGIHLSVQKYVPQYAESPHALKKIFTSSLFACFLWSLAITIICLSLNKIPGILFNSQEVTQGFIYAIPGLLFFALNKVMLSYINGLRYMKMFAILGTLRFVFMIILLVLLIYLKLPTKYLPLVLSLPELFLFILLFFLSLKNISLTPVHSIIKIAALHFRFGNKAALGHIVLDINSKVDLILLGVFLTDSAVGIYSFAAFVVDGFIQIFFVFRNNINPIITDYYYSKNSDLLSVFIKSSIKNFYKIFIFIGVLFIIFYPSLFLLLKNNEDLWSSYYIFMILSAGCLIGSGFIPFQMIFNQTGKPNIQSKFLFLIFLSNLLLNLGLIPIWGIWGSAIATSLVYVIQVFFLKLLSKKYLNLNI